MAEVVVIQLPAQFRALQDINVFWNASECCLIHADTQVQRRNPDDMSETGVVHEPVRAYGP